MNKIGNIDPCLNTIIETNSIKTILEYAKNSESLVIFDVDKTLGYTGQELGSEQWAYWLVKQKLMQGEGLAQAIKSMLELYKFVHEHIELRPVEPDTVLVVNQLKERSIPAICMTGRPGNMADCTYQQITNLGISFLCPQEFDQILRVGITESAKLYKGFLCIGLAEKGTMFLQALDSVDYPNPSLVIFVDDKKESVDSVSLACKRKNIPFLGFRYGYLDNKEGPFDGQRAQEQLNQLLAKVGLPK